MNILSRFVVATRVDPDSGNGPPVCDPAREERILEWPSEGHDGGAVVFGQDGKLFVSTGDGTADSDTTSPLKMPAICSEKFCGSMSTSRRAG